MPFMGVEAPCHALGLIKTYFNNLNIPCDVLYLNLAFAETIGLDSYDVGHNPCFAKAAFGDAVAPFSDPNLKHIPENTYEDFIETCVADYDWNAYDVVLFTSVMSICTTASFALARRLKETFDVSIGIGGSAMFWGAGEEYIKIPWIDYVFTGHVDANGLGNFIRAIQTGDDSLFLTVPGLCRYIDGEVVKSPREFVLDMNEVPVPDYSDYFEQLAKQSFSVTPEFKSRLYSGLIYVEFARGCFYGDSQICSFCSEVGIQKSNERSLENGLRYFADLTDIYPEQGVFFLTEPLLGRTMQRHTLPEWNKIRPSHQRYVCEVKPWMSRAEIKSLAECGVICVICGIESLHPQIIKLLRKGQKQHTCISALKWFKTYGIYAFWNFLAQIPGEKQEYYQETKELLPAIRHLPKPAKEMLPIYVSKGTPYWSEREVWNFENLRPNKNYQHMVPNWLDSEAVSFAWEYDVEGRSNLEIWQPGHLAVQEEINRWHEQEFTLNLAGNTVTDSRSGSAIYFELSDVERDCLVFCDTPKNLDQLGEFGSAILDSLIANKLIIKSEHKFISLPIIPDDEMYYKQAR
jgi:magnesium-protoporphyrin IX monomethyl ester (oxidative) cyclase